MTFFLKENTPSVFEKRLTGVDYDTITGTGLIFFPFPFVILGFFNPVIIRNINYLKKKTFNI
jgi:hypothetical protein